MDTKIISLTNFIKEQFQHEGTGHDWFHIERVTKLALRIQEQEGGDRACVHVAALLHDISDHKFNGGDFEKGGKEALLLLKKLEFPITFAEKVADIVNAVSYKGANVKDKMNCLEGKIVQDADRLDAIGAIGIARAFAYGGAINQPIYDPTVEPTQHASKEEYLKNRTHTVNHFYEKLLLLKDRLHTPTAKKMAEQRHAFMEQFLAEFYKEWNVKQIDF